MMNLISCIYGNAVNSDYPTADVDTMTKYLYDKNAKSTKEVSLDIDRIHPGAYGHEVIAETIYDTIYQAITMPQTDRSVLLTRIEYADSLKENEYTTNSWRIFIEALQEAKQVYEKEDATQTDIDHASMTLQKACDQLQKKGSIAKTILEQIIVKTEGYITGNKLDTLAPSVQNMIKTRFAAAKVILNDNDSRDAQYVSAWLNLADALHYMDFTADKQYLEALIDACDKLDIHDYVEGVEAFQIALTNAKQILNDDNVLQERINKAYNDLMSAKDDLILGNADQALLQSLIDNVTAAVHNSNYYTQDSWLNYSTALEDAWTVLKNKDASKADIIKAYKALTSAYEELRLLPNEALLNELNAFLDMMDTIDLSYYAEGDRAMFMNVTDKARNLLNNFNNITDEDQDMIRNEIANVKRRLHEGKLDKTIETAKPESELPMTEDVQSDKQTSDDMITKTPVIAKTGDTTNIQVISMLCLAGLGTMRLIRKRRR